MAKLALHGASLRCTLHVKHVQVVAENLQQRPLGSHFSVGRRIRCNTRLSSKKHRSKTKAICVTNKSPPVHEILSETKRFLKKKINTNKIMSKIGADASAAHSDRSAIPRKRNGCCWVYRFRTNNHWNPPFQVY